MSQTIKAMGILVQEKKAGLALVCDNAPYTLAMTLASYERSGLLKYFDEVCVVYPEGARKVKAQADAYSLPAVPSPVERGFIGAIYTAVNTMQSDYIVVAEDDCLVWEHLKDDALERELKSAVNLLETNQAHMVRLRHAWRGNTRYKAAYEYSYYHSVEQLATLWLHSEGLSEAPEWVKALRRLSHPVRARRSIGRSVYVEENPHLRFPQYIRKVDDAYIIDSEVFHWTNQPTFISRALMNALLTGLGVTHNSTGDIGPLLRDFEAAVNNPRWRKAHMNIGVTEGIFT